MSKHNVRKKNGQGTVKIPVLHTKTLTFEVPTVDPVSIQLDQLPL
jgi:hypothetical protein